MEKEKLLRSVFIIAAFGALLFVVIRLMPPIAISRPVQMLLVKQNSQIDSLDTPENRDFAVKMRVPSIDFPEGWELKHRKLGPLGYKANFFIDFDCRMNVKKAGNFTFHVASDDGFRLWIDGKVIGEFLTSRPMSTNSFTLYLTPGKHIYHLKYYQGYGALGLFAGYQFMDDGKIRPVGIGSSSLWFE